MKKLIFIFLFFLSFNIYAQKYFAECTIKSNYWKDGICGNNSYYFKDLRLASPLSYITFSPPNPTTIYYYDPSDILWLYSGNYNISTNIVYRVVEKNNYLGLFINAENLNAGNSQQIIHYIDSAKTYSRKEYGTSRLIGFCNHHGIISHQVTTYGAAEISNVNGSVGGSHCISSINDSITINLSAVNPSSSSLLYLRVYTAGSSTLDGKQENFTDHKLKLENSYFYRIKVICENGTISGFSDEIKVKL